jgi:DNA-binding transcriptional ArsR family regulator
MASPFEQITALDKLIHEPARLAILAALSNAKSADFMFLNNITGLNKGNLSLHLSKLEQGGIVTIHKEFVDRKPHTWVSLTPKGRAAFQDYWKKMELLKKSASSWQPKEAK